MRKKINFLYSWLVWLMTFFLPDAPFFMRFRGWLYSFGMYDCGKNFQVASSVKILGLSNLDCGSDVYLASGVIINARAKIQIADEVLIGIGSLLVSSNHTKHQGSYRYGKPEALPIFVGKGTWVAGQVVIGAGSIIPEGCLIGANSYVNKKLVDVGIYAGTPVKYIKK
ncbi:acyltransferase [Vibrio metschnikovii]|uniref:acyltransferase n=1 Tax=Vibrio metschnikovii TaxID=28172 RepID=UPI001C2F92FF|nr:acyltransferase [Vibrio metschnikovii]MDA3139741.1 acyltransferase [Vibrio metschnikovii]